MLRASHEFVMPFGNAKAKECLMRTLLLLVLICLSNLQADESSYDHSTKGQEESAATESTDRTGSASSNSGSTFTGTEQDVCAVQRKDGSDSSWSDKK